MTQDNDYIGHKTFSDGQGGFRHEPLTKAEGEEGTVKMADIVEQARKAEELVGGGLYGKLADEIERICAERDSEREARKRCEDALRKKDGAIYVLFSRLLDAGVDFSDLIP